MFHSLNSFLEKYMALVTPACLLTGVLFPEIAGKFVPFVPLLFAFMTFIGGLKSGFSDLVSVFRRPLPLLLCLFCLHVLVPLLALLMGYLIFPENANIVTGMVLEFVVPSAVVGIMWTGIYRGSSSLILALVIIDTLLAPFSIPFTISLLIGSSVQIDAADMMQELLFMIALPALLAMILNEATHGYTRRVLPGKLAIVSKFCLILVVTANSSKISDYIRHMTPERFLVAGAILLIAASGYALGWLAARLFRQNYETKVAMVFGSGMRNISAGAVIAGSYFPAEVLFPVMVGTIFQQLLAACFGTLLAWFSKSSGSTSDRHGTRL